MNNYFGNLLSRLCLISLLTIAPFSSEAQQYAVIKGSDINIRSGPGKNYGIDGVAKRGDTVMVINESKGWSEITTKTNLKGFVATSFLEKQSGGNVATPASSREKNANWGVILVAIVILFLLGRKLQPKQRSRKKRYSTHAFKNRYETTQKTPGYTIPTMSEKTISKQKGDEFEEFIAKKIAKNKCLKIKHWRSDKITKDQRISAESNKYPDFEVLFGLSYANQWIEHKFAIECKWRKIFFNDNIEISNRQIDNYKAYAVQENMAVYIVIGYGGTAAYPERLYLVPLTEIYDGMMSIDFLEKFKCNTSDFFYYIWQTHKLTLRPRN